ncbi:tol-pal system-associated acyl-CoA thioesterase [Legionella impletisoli]|uniref:Tol-pal system-associated acyl-CoA thioesterase n=2 Tax=Legionella impletisoli TaxID=343510 RepID=A0A917JMK5_9GAMM|nr:tol-pal system-associated acyl-CoA thioesterase [Legionella impletisoli]
MGIVYHANYLCFFERARSELLRELGFSLPKLAKSGTQFAIKEAKIRYIAPAHLDDQLTIKTTVETHRATSLLFKQMMSNQSDKVLCEGDILVVCLNDALKPRRLPDNLRK